MANAKWLNTEKENFVIEDDNGNKYTISNILQIQNKEKLEITEKVVLIFNITTYNESNIITLTGENGSLVKFVKI